MREIKLLIVDDDDDVIEEFKNSIEMYNRDNDNIKYKPYVANNLDEAKEKLETYIIDTAIIDINLNNSSGDDNVDGNSVIEEILKYFRMPIFVVSGTPDKLDDSLKNNVMIKRYTREVDTNQKLFETDIPNSIKSSTLKYFSRNGYLEKEIAKIYWEYLSQTIEYWEQVTEEFSQEEIDKILSRHTLSCLNEKLYVNGNIGRFDEYHFGEMYIKPPIKQHYHTGDIVKKDEEYFIILNPACDIVNIDINKPYKSKLIFYILAKIISISQISKIQHCNKDKNKNIQEIKKNSGGGSYHFLPMFADIFPQDSDGYVIDFQNLQMVQLGLDLNQTYNNIEQYIKAREQFIVKYERVASIASPFLKDIIARFSHYYARQGQPKFMEIK